MGKVQPRKRMRKPFKKEKPWLQRKKKLQQGEGRPQAISKWVHHALKLLHKVLKKARLFEQRKAGRRLAQCREKITAGDAEAPTQVDKFQQQVEAIKAMDLTVLAKQVMIGLRLNFSGSDQADEEEEQQHVPASLQGVTPLCVGPNSEVRSQMAARIASVPCVRQQLESISKDFKLKFGVNAAATAEAAEPVDAVRAEKEAAGTTSDDPDVEDVLEKLKKKRRETAENIHNAPLNGRDNPSSGGESPRKRLRTVSLGHGDGGKSTGRQFEAVRKLTPCNGHANDATPSGSDTAAGSPDDGADSADKDADSEGRHAGFSDQHANSEDDGADSAELDADFVSEDDSGPRASLQSRQRRSGGANGGGLRGMDADDELMHDDNGDEAAGDGGDSASFDSAEFDRPGGQQGTSDLDDSAGYDGGGGEDSDVAISESDIEDNESDLAGVDLDAEDIAHESGKQGRKEGGSAGGSMPRGLSRNGENRKGGLAGARISNQGLQMSKDAGKHHSKSKPGLNGKDSSEKKGKDRAGKKGKDKGLKVAKPAGKRLGQRARRLMHEKMFGSNARHLQLQGGAGGPQTPMQSHFPAGRGGELRRGTSGHRPTRPNGIAKPGANPGSRPPYRAAGGNYAEATNARGGSIVKGARNMRGAGNVRGASNATGAATFGEAKAQVSGQKPEAENLHPSWQAKRLQAQKLVICATAPPQAKKVVFTDDD